MSFTPEDLEQLAAAGIDVESALAQLSFLRDNPPPLRLVRPCRIGDGIDLLDAAEFPRLEALAREAARRGRVTVFLPASGAATRMFESSDARARGAAIDRQLWQGIEDALEARLPKALMPFHRDGKRLRTAFAEQLLEASGYATDGGGVCRVHATVASGFEERFQREAREISAETGVRFDLGLSLQNPSTDTLALDEHGEAFRLDSGSLLLRPGGHGALFVNLSTLTQAGADLVVIKNIDNVLPAPRRAEVVDWKRRLLGHLLRLHESAAAAADDDRPTRVCGMVPNLGEPGGGPFWVRDRQGPPESIRPQIVESAQVDMTAPDQSALWRSATHFNPVDLVCAVRDRHGRPHELERFRDPAAVFVTRKSWEGRSLLALEHPGLWNGAMALWRTAFVEVPATTFAPVKTLSDLLRPDRQAEAPA